MRLVCPAFDPLDLAGRVANEGCQMARICLVFASMMVLCSPALAEDGASGEGKELCRTWTAANDISRSAAMKAWVRDFVAIYAHKKAVDPPKLMRWIDDFCRANPGTDIYTAANVYIDTELADGPLYL